MPRLKLDTVYGGEILFRTTNYDKSTGNETEINNKIITMEP